MDKIYLDSLHSQLSCSLARKQGKLYSMHVRIKDFKIKKKIPPQKNTKQTNKQKTKKQQNKTKKQKQKTKLLEKEISSTLYLSSAL